MVQYRHRSQKTPTLLAKYADRFEVMALPTYSPKLNLIVRFWKHLPPRQASALRKPLVSGGFAFLEQ